jgi:hypothetical protein
MVQLKSGVETSDIGPGKQRPMYLLPLAVYGGLRIWGWNPSDFLGSSMLSCHVAKEDRQLLIEKTPSDEFTIEGNLHLETKKKKTVTRSLSCSINR